MELTVFPDPPIYIYILSLSIYLYIKNYDTIKERERESCGWTETKEERT